MSASPPHGGLCAEVDPELWFPVQGADPTSAIGICHRCPVRVECLAFALGHTEPLYGVWGGLTAKQRNKIRKAAS